MKTETKLAKPLQDNRGRESQRVSQSGHSLAAIRNSALQEFAEHGFHGTTMRKIARRAEMSTAGIYHHFEKKEEILFDVICGGLNIMVAESESALSVADDPVRQLRKLVRAHVTYHLEHQLEAFVGSSELRSLTGERLGYVQKLRRHQQDMFDITVKKIHEAGYKVVYPDEAARAIGSMGISVARWYKPSGSLTKEDVITRYVELSEALVNT